MLSLYCSNIHSKWRRNIAVMVGSAAIPARNRSLAKCSTTREWPKSASIKNYYTTPTKWQNTTDLQGHWVPELFAKSRIVLTTEPPQSAPTPQNPTPCQRSDRIPLIFGDIVCEVRKNIWEICGDLTLLYEQGGSYEHKQKRQRVETSRQKR